MTRHTALPFGPFLAFGLMVAILLQQGGVLD
jgi:prepilin signal peptidase PulO-like enzyme (type II secretory pathway)